MTDELTPADPAQQRRVLAAGIAIAASAAMLILFMSHHPTVHSHDVSGLAEGINRQGATNRVVHGTLMALLVVQFLGFTVFADLLDTRRLLTRAGLIALALGVLAMLGAATIDGFVLTDLAARYSPGTSERFGAATEVCAAANATLASFGVVLISAAVLFWSLALIRRAGAWRLIGVLGIICGLAPPIAMAADAMRMNVHGMMLFVAVQGVWNLAVAVRMMAARR